MAVGATARVQDPREILCGRHPAGYRRLLPRDRHPTAPCAALRSGGGSAPAAARPGVGPPRAADVSGALVAGLLAGYGIAIPVGAIAALIIGLTARTSLRVGAAAALGVATADGLYAAVAVLGGAALGRLIEPLATPLRWSAVAVLLALAGRTAVSAIRQHREAAVARPTGGLATPRRAYLGLLGLTLLNPSTIVYFGALVVGRRSADDPGAAAEFSFVVGAFAASASWQLVLAGGGSVVGRALTGARGRLATSLVSSIVIAALALRLLLGG